MTNFKIEWEHPWLLLLLIPILFFSLFPFFRLSKKYRRNRNRIISVVTHTVAMLLCLAMMAGMTFAYAVPNRQNELIVLVDRSDSGAENEAKREDFLQSVIDACDKNYKIGIVSFGYDVVYSAPLSFDKRETYKQYLSAAEPDTSATNLAGAIAFALEQFENPKTAKILILSDGLETDGNVLSAVKMATAKGVRVDAVNLANTEQREMQILDVKMPENRVVLGQETTITLTIQTNLKEEQSVDLSVSDMGYKGSSEQVRLTRGTQTVKIHHTFQSAGLHDLRFELTGQQGTDTVSQNNVYHAYYNIPLLENILILESKRGEAATLASILGSEHTVDVTNIHDEPEKIPSDVRSLSSYEEVFLVNISNEDLEGKSMPENFVQTLYDYVYTVGGGLFTVGGENDISSADGTTLVPHAYNRLDMEGSLLQQMLPVQVVEYTPPLAVVIVVDSSGTMSMGLYEAALKVAKEIVNSLNPRDYCGVITFASSASEDINVVSMAQKDKILDVIQSLQNASSGSGGTVYSGAIELAGKALAPIPVERRHIVLVTDGKPSDPLESDKKDTPAYGKYIRDNYRLNGTTMSIFALDMTSGSRDELKKAAEELGHGHFYDIPSSELHRVQAYAKADMAEIMLAEFREGEKFTPKMRDQSTALTGIDTTTIIPALHGYYGTKLKDAAKAPLFYEFAPIYAEWDFGAGRVGSFMSDLGGAWSKEFTSDPVGQQLILNMADSLSPSDDLEPDKLEFSLRFYEDNYSTRLDVFTSLNKGETVGVTVRPLSEDAARFYGGDVPVTAAGDNIGFNYSITCGGVYRITIEKKDADGNVIATRSVCKTFSYSEEYQMFRDPDEGEKLLASLVTSGNGSMITDPVETFETFSKTYPKTADPRMAFLILAILCILIDIAVRKFKFKWPHEILRDRKKLKEMAGEAEEKKR